MEWGRTEKDLGSLDAKPVVASVVVDGGLPFVALPLPAELHSLRAYIYNKV